MANQTGTVESIVKDLSTMPDPTKQKHKTHKHTPQKLVNTVALVEAVEAFSGVKNLSTVLDIKESTLHNYIRRGKMPIPAKYACLGIMHHKFPQEAKSHILVVRVPTTESNLIHKILEATGATIYGDIPV